MNKDLKVLAVMDCQSHANVKSVWSDFHTAVKWNWSRFKIGSSDQSTLRMAFSLLTSKLSDMSGRRSGNYNGYSSSRRFIGLVTACNPTLLLYMHSWHKDRPVNGCMVECCVYILVLFSMWKWWILKSNWYESKQTTTSVLWEGRNYKPFTAALKVYEGMSVLYPEWTI